MMTMVMTMMNDDHKTNLLPPSGSVTLLKSLCFPGPQFPHQFIGRWPHGYVTMWSVTHSGDWTGETVREHGRGHCWAGPLFKGAGGLLPQVSVCPAYITHLKHLTDGEPEWGWGSEWYPQWLLHIAQCNHGPSRLQLTDWALRKQNKTKQNI